MLLSLQILIKAADREKEGINVTEAGERVYRAMLRVSWREGVLDNAEGECERVYRAMLRVSWREGLLSNAEGELEGGCTRQC